MATSTTRITESAGSLGGTARIRRQLSLVWADHRVLIIGLAVTLLALLLRFFEIGANGYRLDEVWSIWIAGQSVPDMIGNFLFNNVDYTPPTYYMMLQPFLAFGHGALEMRALPAIAGALVAPLTFRFALELFDLRVASVAALIVAVEPLQLEYSQVSRSYIMVSLFALLSLYFFARLVLGRGSRLVWVGFAAASIAMLYMHYLAVLVIVFENLYIGILWLRRKLPWPGIRGWVLSQAAVGVAALPLVATSLYSVTHMTAGRGFAWLPKPDAKALIKSAILFTTGDPSYGPTGVTPERAVSLAALGAICAIGLWLLLRRGVDLREDRRKVILLVSAVVVPLGIALAVSQVRSIYHEKYYLFAIPPLAILLAWVFVRADRWWARIPAVVFACVVGLAVYVYFTAPTGEQWREAMTYLRQQYKPGDTVLIAPGYYGRPFAYYFYGGFPSDMRTLGFAPMVEVQNNKYAAEYFSESGQANPPVQPTGKVWLVTGYTGVTDDVQAWLKSQFREQGGVDLLGAHVHVLQRAGVTDGK